MGREGVRGAIVDLYVKPGSGSFRIEVSGDEITVFCRSPPEGGKANLEIIKQLIKIFGSEVSLVSGGKSRVKRVLITGSTPEQVRAVLAAHSG